MSNSLLEVIKARKNFYRDYYRNLSGILIGLFVLIIVLNVLIVYLYITRPIPNFYATSMDGKLIQLVPLDKPNYSSKPLIE